MKTKDLEEMLLNVDDEKSLSEYLEALKKEPKPDSFPYYFNSVIARKKENLKEIIHDSGIEKSYAYHILSGKKKRPGRDKILRLCIAGNFSVEETRKALEAAGEATIYARSSRDSLIQYALIHNYTVVETDLLLDEHGEDPLD